MRIWTYIVVAAIMFAGFSGCSCEDSPTPPIVDPLNVSIVINDSLATTRDTALHVTIFGQNLHQMQLSLDSTLTDAEWTEFIDTQTVHVPHIEGDVTVYARLSSAAGGQTNILSDDIELDFTATILRIDVVAPGRLLVPGDQLIVTAYTGEEGKATVSFADVIVDATMDYVGNGIFSDTITVPQGIPTESALVICNFTDVAGNVSEPDTANQRFIVTGSMLNPHIIGWTETNWNIGYDMWYSGGYCFVGQRSFLHAINLEDLTNPVWHHLLEFNADIFGMSGNDSYLFVAADNQLKIVDINPPEHASVALWYPLGGNIRDVKLDHGWAYVTSLFDGLRVMNIDEVGSIDIISELDLNITGEHIWQRDELLYIVGAAGVSIVDISVREEPVLLSNLYLNGDMEDLVYYDNKLYLATRATGIVTVDVSDPTQPELERTFTSFGVVNDLALGTPYLYISGGNSVRIVNITNDDLPIMAVIGAIQGTHGISLSDRHLFVAGHEKFVVVELFDE